MKSKIPQYISLAITTALCAFSIAEVLFSPEYIGQDGEPGKYVVIDVVKYGAIGLSVVYALVFAKSKYWNHVFVFLLFCSVFGLVQFSSWSIWTTLFGLEIKLGGLALLIIHLALNPAISKVIRKALFPQEEKGAGELSEAQVKAFEKRYEEKNLKQLQTIVEENRYVPEAVEAAKNLLITRDEKAN